MLYYKFRNLSNIRDQKIYNYTIILHNVFCDFFNLLEILTKVNPNYSF